MKKIFYLLSLFLITACADLDKVLTFNIINQTDLVIPSSINMGTPIPIPTPDVQTNSAQEFSNNRTAKNLVKDVRLTSLSLYIQNPTGKSFSFLKSLDIYIAGDGLPEEKIAYLNDIPANVGNSLDLISTNIKLDAYLKKDKYIIKAKVVTDEVLTQEVEIKANMKFKVTADPL